MYRDILPDKDNSRHYDHPESSISELFCACLPFRRRDATGAFYLIKKDSYRGTYLAAIEYHHPDDPIDPTTILARSDTINKDLYGCLFQAFSFEYTSAEPRVGHCWRYSDPKKISDAFYAALDKISDN